MKTYNDQGGWIMKKTVFLACLALLLAGGIASAAYGVGDKIDDFTLMDSEGESWTLSSVEGKVIMINFWGSG